MENTIQDLQNLSLTENDFKLLVDGLDELPNKGATGEIFSALLSNMVLKDDPEAKAKFENDREVEKQKRLKEKDLMMEEVKILQGKLLLLKRFLIQNNLLKQAHDLIK
jgi:hypothetical protein